MPEYALGKKPPRHDPRTLRYGAYRTDYTLAVPGQAHWGHGLPYGMLGNADWGDCVEAGALHQVQVVCDRAGHPFAPATAEALSAYSTLTGFDPNAGPPGSNPTDNGTDMLASCQFWRSAGYAGHVIDSYLSVRPQDTQHVRESVAFYGGLYLGIAMPVSAQAQVGGLWEVATGPDAEAGSWGGHCVVITGYDADRLWCCTWGTLQAMTWEWLVTYADEAYVTLSRDWLRATGLSPSGLAWGALQADLANL